MSLPLFFIHIYSFIRCGLNPTAVANMLGTMVPIMALCITVAGFIIFWYMCRPFTKYRKWIFSIILLSVILLLLAVPDFFLLNGTEYMKELISYGGLWPAIVAIANNLFSFSIYSQFNVDQWIIISVFLLTSSFLYIATNKVINKIHEMRHKEKDYDEVQSFGDVIDRMREKKNKK